MKLKCIAVDDEPLALDLVCKYIAQTAFLDLVGKFSSAIEALGFINQHEVQLIFMDIQMPDLSGMELARVLDGKKNAEQTRIIFATAYHQFAIEGYKVDALDYLLKPYSYEEFLNASTKAYNYFERQKEKKNEVENDAANAPDYIFLKVEYQLVKVMLSDITHVEAYKDYVKIHLKSKVSPLLSLTSLKSMEELLPSSRFMRVHRSYIVALDHIDSVSKNIIHIGNHQVSVSDNHKEAFLEFMSRWMN
ncbi:two component transcriptional regulator, LytTR family [Algoriphagus faecimaris]|uniref:Two component transcriptional regulator, LytTR family n=1 Tax=Algoriphagus faecimaris TaxID=686796 RepID=A0A1G6USZ7_9BACT|nr:LytTR family DNA-binding domain-containing protein [Algoriphagus faecimaris]SDD43836.1 two component transcriptional regulator, LytTR family [Algoriphagus faecimaris]